jgi:hypothetical protein
MTAQPTFKVGDKVRWLGFTDCFGKFHPEVRDLIVNRVRLVEPQTFASTMPSYYRVLAYEAEGLGGVEGAERFFEAM